MIGSIDQAGAVDMIRPKQGIRDIRAAGFLNLTAAYAFADIHDMAKGKESAAYYEEKRSIIEEGIVRTLPEEGISIPMLKGPALRFLAKKDLDNRRFEEESVKAVELAVRAGIYYVLINPLFAGIDPEKLWEENRAFYLRMEEACRRAEASAAHAGENASSRADRASASQENASSRADKASASQENASSRADRASASHPQVQILLPNYPRFLNGHYVRGIFTDEGKTADFIDGLNAACGCTRFGFALDAGYASLCGKDMYNMIVTLGDRVKAVILSDCDGHNVQRCLPTLMGGATDWLSLIRGMRAIGFDGILSLDIAGTLGAIPLFYRDKIYPLAKATLDYFVWQMEMERKVHSYENIVLFGAGNMCRNYMLWFGETKKPLFTCDNNSRLWGTQFEGLTIHDPKDLGNPEWIPDPGHTGIFICNMYYREIREQLEAMGVKNIEFFNDEFMPRSYFDRYDSLKRGISGKNG